MKFCIVVIALVVVGAFAQEHPPSPERGAVPCFYWDDECTSSYGVDFPGNDVAIYGTNTTTECCDRCKATEGCLHWVARGDGQGGYICHLKSVYGFPTYCSECTFSYTKSEACKQFCESTCHNLNQFGPAVCGTDGYTYESPCQMTCTGVSKADDGECDSPFREPSPGTIPTHLITGPSEPVVVTETETKTETETEPVTETEVETEPVTETEVETEPQPTAPVAHASGEASGSTSSSVHTSTETSTETSHGL